MRGKPLVESFSPHRKHQSCNDNKPISWISIHLIKGIAYNQDHLLVFDGLCSVPPVNYLQVL